MICRKSSRDVFAMANITTIISYPVSKTNLLSLFRIWRCIRTFSPETLFATYPSNTLFQTLIVIVSGALTKIRHEHPKDKNTDVDFKFIYDKIIPLDPEKNQVENNLRLLGTSASDTKRNLFPLVNLSSSHETRRLIKPKTTFLPVIGIHAGGNRDAKRYPAKAFAEVANILGQQGYHIIVLGSDKEKHINSQILKYAQIENIQDLTGRFTLRELGQILGSCRCLVCNDNGIMHLADWLGIPLVVLFSQTDPAIVGPIHSQYRICYHPTAISAIKSHQVVANVNMVLRQTRPNMEFSCKMD